MTRTREEFAAKMRAIMFNARPSLWETLEDPTHRAYWATVDIVRRHPSLRPPGWMDPGPRPKRNRVEPRSKANSITYTVTIPPEAKPKARKKGKKP